MRRALAPQCTSNPLPCASTSLSSLEGMSGEDIGGSPPLLSGGYCGTTDTCRTISFGLLVSGTEARRERAQGTLRDDAGEAPCPVVRGRATVTVKPGEDLGTIPAGIELSMLETS